MPRSTATSCSSARCRTSTRWCGSSISTRATPRCCVDSNHARIIVFGLGAVESRDEVSSEKTRRHSMGGWSQARYQRRTENLQLQHLKEVVERLERVVRDEGIERVIVAGDAGLVARLREQLPAPLAAKIVDVLRFDRHAGEDEIVGEALQALRERDAEDDRQRVAEVLGAWRGAGLGVAGPERPCARCSSGRWTSC